MNAPRSPGWDSGSVLAGTHACATHAPCSSGNLRPASANAGAVRVSDAATADVTAINLTCVPPGSRGRTQPARRLSRAAHGGSSRAHEIRGWAAWTLVRSPLRTMRYGILGQLEVRDG